MNPVILNDEQGDVLQEMVNIGIGRASSSIAEMFDTFIHLSVPIIKLSDSRDVMSDLERNFGNSQVSTVRQGFHGQLLGEVLAIYGNWDSPRLARLVGYDADLGESFHKGLLLDVTNILLGSCVVCFTEQLNLEVAVSPPSVLADNVTADRMMSEVEIISRTTLSMEMVLKSDALGLSCSVLILVPVPGLYTVLDAVNAMLD